MKEHQMTNKETADHLRKWVSIDRIEGHGTFSWCVDGVGYNQHVRFVQYRNENWNGGTPEEFRQFILDYAKKIENEPDTLCICIHPNVKLTHSCYCCQELSCKFSGYNSDGTIFHLGVRG